MKIYKRATRVVITDTNVEGTILSCTITGKNITYKVAYFICGVRYEEDLPEWELTVKSGETQEIGFK